MTGDVFGAILQVSAAAVLIVGAALVAAADAVTSRMWDTFGPPEGAKYPTSCGRGSGADANR